MPDTQGGCVLTTAEAEPAAGPADRMCTTAILPPSPEPPRHPARPRRQIPRRAPSWLGRGILLAGLGMIPWAFILASTLPSTTRAEHWPAAWAGLDGMEAAALITTGVALIRRHRWLCLPAAITSTLLLIDAWFDIATSAPGSAVMVAIGTAIFPELPMAGLCAVLAVRNARDPSVRRRPQSAQESMRLSRKNLDEMAPDRTARTFTARRSLRGGMTRRLNPAASPGSADRRSATSRTAHNNHSRVACPNLDVCQQSSISAVPAHRPPTCPDVKAHADVVLGSPV